MKITDASCNFVDDNGNNQSALSSLDRGRHLQRAREAHGLLNSAHDIEDLHPLLQPLLILADSCPSTNHQPIPFSAWPLPPTSDNRKRKLSSLTHKSDAETVGLILDSAALLVDKPGRHSVPPDARRLLAVPITTTHVIHPHHAGPGGVAHCVSEVGGRCGACRERGHRDKGRTIRTPMNPQIQCHARTHTHTRLHNTSLWLSPGYPQVPLFLSLNP